MAKYLVYRREITNADETRLPAGNETMILCRMPPYRISLLMALYEEFGTRGTTKVLAKLMTPSRSFFGCLIDERLASYGWIMHGHCRQYTIEKDASVIGPIYTKPAYRGRGLAAGAMQSAMMQLAAHKLSVFYIDAHARNNPSLRAIEKAGFTGPVLTFERN